MSNPAIRFGVIVGLISLVVSFFITGAIYMCGPTVALIAGAAAGFFAARAEQESVYNSRVEIGATAGAIAGAFVLIGNILTIVVTVFYVQINLSVLDGNVMTSLWISIISMAGIGFMSVGLAAFAGAGASYLVMPAPAVYPPEQPRSDKRE